MPLIEEIDRPAKFPPAAMADLVDRPVHYDLAESICPPVRLGELLTPELLDRLRELEIGYGTTHGDAELRTLIAADTGVAPGEVLVTAGGSTAMFLLAFALCEPGDHTVLATPCFPPARTVLDALRLRVTPVPLAFDTGYRLDVDAVAAALTPHTRLVSLASPQNPSGIRFTEAELAALVERIDARAPHAVLLVDETYRKTSFTAHAQRSAAGLAPRVVTSSSLSKSHGAPGLRVGWLTCTEPETYERLRLAKFNSLISGSGVDESLATEVLRHQERIFAARRGPLVAALDALTDWAAARRDAVEFLPPDGGAICCLRLRPDRFDDSAVRRFHAALAERDVRVGKGSWFGESDRVLRIGFGHLPVATFAAGLDRLGDVLDALPMA